MPRFRLNPDGSAEIWYLGWKLTFPPKEDRAPEVVEEEKAPPDAGVADKEVQTHGTGLRYGDWIATFDASQKNPPRLRRAKPPKRLTRIIHRYMRYMGRR